MTRRRNSAEPTPRYGRRRHSPVEGQERRSRGAPADFPERRRRRREEGPTPPSEVQQSAPPAQPPPAAPAPAAGADSDADGWQVRPRSLKASEAAGRSAPDPAPERGPPRQQLSPPLQEQQQRQRLDEPSTEPTTPAAAGEERCFLRIDRFRGDQQPLRLKLRPQQPLSELLRNPTLRRRSAEAVLCWERNSRPVIMSSTPRQLCLRLATGKVCPPQLLHRLVFLPGGTGLKSVRRLPLEQERTEAAEPPAEVPGAGAAPAAPGPSPEPPAPPAAAEAAQPPARPKGAGAAPSAGGRQGLAKPGRRSMVLRTLKRKAPESRPAVAERAAPAQPRSPSPARPAEGPPAPAPVRPGHPPAPCEASHEENAAPPLEEVVPKSPSAKAEERAPSEGSGEIHCADSARRSEPESIPPPDTPPSPARGGPPDALQEPHDVGEGANWDGDCWPEEQVRQADHLRLELQSLQLRKQLKEMELTRILARAQRQQGAGDAAAAPPERRPRCPPRAQPQQAEGSSSGFEEEDAWAPAQRTVVGSAPALSDPSGAHVTHVAAEPRKRKKRKKPANKSHAARSVNNSMQMILSNDATVLRNVELALDPIQVETSAAKRRRVVARRSPSPPAEPPAAVRQPAPPQLSAAAAAVTPGEAVLLAALERRMATEYPLAPVSLPAPGSLPASLQSPPVPVAAQPALSPAASLLFQHSFGALQPAGAGGLLSQQLGLGLPGASPAGALGLPPSHFSSGGGAGHF
eukprot:TRINITY_DN3680_c0_g1_i2.p1 TRINITY_DN3680_c0_g1~~TRINITY_DN3680_c0_g1_i2.p1  ORF type:complete len:745 (+),score=161.35 TRINITY_DN3680_c0_g1_i2:92-2326(+)